MKTLSAADRALELEKQNMEMQQRLNDAADPDAAALRRADADLAAIRRGETPAPAVTMEPMDMDWYARRAQPNDSGDASPQVTMSDSQRAIEVEPATGTALSVAPRQRQHSLGEAVRAASEGMERGTTLGFSNAYRNNENGLGTSIARAAAPLLAGPAGLIANAFETYELIDQTNSIQSARQELQDARASGDQARISNASRRLQQIADYIQARGTGGRSSAQARQAEYPGWVNPAQLMGQTGAMIAGGEMAGGLKAASPVVQGAVGGAALEAPSQLAAYSNDQISGEQALHNVAQGAVLGGAAGLGQQLVGRLGRYALDPETIARMRYRGQGFNPTVGEEYGNLVQTSEMLDEMGPRFATERNMRNVYGTFDPKTQTWVRQGTMGEEAQRLYSSSDEAARNASNYRDLMSNAQDELAAAQAGYWQEVQPPAPTAQTTNLLGAPPRAALPAPSEPLITPAPQTEAQAVRQASSLTSPGTNWQRPFQSTWSTTSSPSPQLNEAYAAQYPAGREPMFGPANARPSGAPYGGPEIQMENVVDPQRVNQAQGNVRWWQQSAQDASTRADALKNRADTMRAMQGRWNEDFPLASGNIAPVRGVESRSVLGAVTRHVAGPLWRSGNMVSADVLSAIQRALRNAPQELGSWAQPLKVAADKGTLAAAVWALHANSAAFRQVMENYNEQAPRSVVSPDDERELDRWRGDEMSDEQVLEYLNR